MADYKAITDDQQKEAKIYEGNSGDVDKISQEIDSTQTSLNKLSSWHHFWDSSCLCRPFLQSG